MSDAFDGPTKIDQNQDGCWPACIAMLTGIPLDELPHPMPEELRREEWSHFHNRVLSAMHGRGWTIAALGSRVPTGYAIASGIGPRDRNHAVVVLDGKLYHDPHPSRAGLETVHEYEIVIRIVGGRWTIDEAS